MYRLPNWVYNMIAALEVWEDTHPTDTHGDMFSCVADILAVVPQSVRHEAAAIRHYLGNLERE